MEYGQLSYQQSNVVICPVEITERNSTLAHNISDPHIRNVMKFIDTNYMNDITMDDIFELVPLSRRSVELRFKKATGMTIYQHLLSTRVEHLAYLLRTTDRPYAELAYEVGFRDISNVSRTFRKYKNYTPLEYRRQFSI
jgi:LacI family transcriptional regulator